MLKRLASRALDPFISQQLRTFSVPNGGRLFSVALISQALTEKESKQLNPKNSTSSELSDGDDKVVQQALHCLGQGEWGRSTLWRLEKQKLVLNSAQVAQILKKEQNAERAYGFLKWVQSQGACQLDASTYLTVIKLLGKHEMLDPMMDLVKGMHEKGIGVSEEIMKRVIVKLAGSKRLKEAIEMFCELERYGWKPSISSYNCLIILLYEGGLSKEGDSFLRKMEELGWSPDILSCSARINSLLRAGKHDAACELCLQMFQKGLFLNTQTYCNLLKVLCSKAEVVSLWKVYNQMKLSKIFLPEGMYVILIKGLIKSGNVDDAHELFKDMIVFEKSPPANLCAYVITTLIRFGRMPAARILVEELIHVNKLPDPPAFRSFVGHLTRAAMIKSAWELLRELKARNTELEIHTSDMLAYSFAKRLKKGFSDEAVHKIVEQGGNPLLLTTNMLIHCLCEAEQYEPVLNFYSYLKGTGLDLNVYTYSVVIDALRKAGRIDDAYNVFQDSCAKHVSLSKETHACLFEKLGEIGNGPAVESMQNFVDQECN